MSDFIVLWRMCVVWENSRPIIFCAMALLVTTLGLNIANIAGIEGNAAGAAVISSVCVTNFQDSELLSTYGENSIGLAAAFVSLASNIIATTLVGFKVWCVTDMPVISSQFTFRVSAQATPKAIVRAHPL